MIEIQKRCFYMAHPENVRCCAFVRGFESDERDAIVERRVAQDAWPEDGVLRDVAGREHAREDVRETLLHRFGVSVPRQLLRAGLLHFTLLTHEGTRLRIYPPKKREKKRKQTTTRS